MTANSSEDHRNAETAAPHVDDLDTDPHHDALSSDNDPVVDDADTRSPAELAEEREERSVNAGSHADQRPTIPAVPKPVVPAVAGILTFVLLAFPFGWTIAGAVIGGLVAAAVSYAFVFRL